MSCWRNYTCDVLKDVDKNIMEWIGQYYDIKDETVLRGFLGRM